MSMAAERVMEEARRHAADRDAAVRAFVSAIAAGDVSAADRALSNVRNEMVLPQALAMIGRLGSVPDVIRQWFLAVWIRDGDELREGASDLLTLGALRVLLPPYRGDAVRLFRGDGLPNRRRRTYGLSWSTSSEIAATFAEAHRGHYVGGTVLLEVDAPPEAILCAPAEVMNAYEEHEYIVDRRRLRGVRVVAHFPNEGIADGETGVSLAERG